MQALDEFRISLVQWYSDDMDIYLPEKQADLTPTLAV